MGTYSHSTGTKVVANSVTIAIPIISRGSPALAIFLAVTGTLANTIALGEHDLIKRASYYYESFYQEQIESMLSSIL